MRINRKKVEAGLKVAAVTARTAGRKAASQLAIAGDEALRRLGEGAKKRQRARQNKSTLKKLGKVALVTGAVVAVRTVARRRTAS